MTLFINSIFWIIAIAVYLLLLMRLPGRLTFRFGLLNLAALTVLLGWGVSLGVLGFVLLVWTALNLVALLNNKSNFAGRSLISLGFFAGLLFLFSLHKFNLADLEFSAQLKQTVPWFPAEILLPFFVTLSFSYIFFRCIDLAHSCIWKNKPLVDPISLVGYLVPFHMLAAGPVNIYDEHIRINESPPPPMTPSAALLVINEITTGLFYKFVLAEGIRIYFYGLDGNISANEWFDSFILLIYVFFDFAGYSRVARGLGLLYGIPTPVNFNAPFLATSVTEFWTRWHMSLGQFVLRNLFTPMQLQLVRRFGVKWSTAASIVTLVVSFSFVGLWHRFSWAWFLWGVGMGILVAVEKIVWTFLLKEKWNQVGKIKIAIDSLGRVYAFLMISLSLYFVANEVFLT